jgi:hypothetical protein
MDETTTASNFGSLLQNEDKPGTSKKTVVTEACINGPVATLAFEYGHLLSN